MDSLTYDQQSTPGMMDALIEMLRMKRQQETQPPQGVGPVASGDTYGEMLRPREAGSIPLDVGQPAQGPVENAPIDQIIAALTPGKSDLAMAGMGREIAQFTGPRGLDWLPAEERSRVVGKPSGKNNKVSVSSDVPAPTEGESPTPLIEDVKKSVGPSAGDVAKPTPEQVVATKEILQEKIASSTTMTPEEKQQKTNELNSDPSIGQKLAMIAMAVAPTLVGYAAGGTKGAYLGAASTGKGLEAGAKSYQEEDQFNKKQALEREKIAADKKKESGSKFDKIIKDKYGKMYFYDEANNLNPVKLPDGTQATDANVAQYNPITGLQVGNKYETAPGQRRAGVIRMSDELDTLGIMASQVEDSKGNKKLPIGVAVDPVLRAWAAKYPEWKAGDPAPEGETEATASVITNTFHNNKDKIMDQLRKASTAGKTESEKKPPPSIQEKASIAAYIADVTEWNKGTWKAHKASQSSAEMFFKRPLSEIKAKGVADSALWFLYMKEIQQDASVVREGDIATAMRFMDTKTKIDSWMNQYGMNLGSAMTEEMRKYIVNYLAEVRQIKDRLALTDINSMTTKGLRLGFEAAKVPVSSTAQDDARNWANPKIKAAPTLGMASGTPIWGNRIKEMVASGDLKNGQFVKDTDGTPYLIEFYKGQTGKIGVRTRYWAVK